VKPKNRPRHDAGRDLTATLNGWVTLSGGQHVYVKGGKVHFGGPPSKGGEGAADPTKGPSDYRKPGALAEGLAALAEKRAKQARRQGNEKLAKAYEAEAEKHRSGKSGIKTTGPKTNTLHELVAKLNAARLRRETLHGREYLVVPTTILRPDSVMNGSKGPLFYPRSEVAKNPGAWNGVPLLLNHPSEGTTGRDPRVLAAAGLGYLYNDRLTGNGTRVADAWFDVELVKRHDAALPADRRMMPRLESGKPIDVSTGLYTDDRPVKNGVKLKDYRGRPYSGDVATNYRPDHLAVLPTSKGACPAPDCGTHVANARKPSGKLDMSPDKACKIVHDGSVNGHPLTDAQRGMFGALCGKRGHAKNADGTCDTCTNNNEGEPMALTAKQRKAKVSYLTANCECWKDKADTLNELDDEALAAVASQAEQLANNVEAVEAVRETLGLEDELVFNAEFVKSPDMKAKMKAACEPEPEPVVKKNKARKTVENDEDDDALQTAIDEAVAKAVAAHPTVKNAERTVAKERANLRARLTVVANTRGTTPAKKTLILNKLKDAALPNDQLEELLTLVGEPTSNRRHPVSDDDGDPDYTGAGSGYGEVVGNDGDATENAEELGKFAADGGMTPTVNWENRVAEHMNGQAKGKAK
jgi:hypothetical protein